MALNLRHLSEELHKLLKVRAATEGVTIESLCVRFLWQGLDYEKTMDDMSFSKKPNTVVKAPKLNKKEQSDLNVCPKCHHINGLHQRGCHG